jgi:hypothetical protein
MGTESVSEQVLLSQDLDWLIWSLREARIRRVSDRELLAAVRRGLPKARRQAILKEIERRLGFWSGREQRSLAYALNHLHRKHSQPGSTAQEVDQLLRRLLWQIRGKGARKLALDCIESPRLQRRMAAWRFYGHDGLDEAARTCAAKRAPEESHTYFFQLVANDAELIDQIGLSVVLNGFQEFYWRGRVFQTYFSGGNQVDENATSHPGEAIFGIRRAERKDLIPEAARLMNENLLSLQVISAAIQCFGALGALPELAEAEAAGKRLLEEAPPQQKEFRQLDQVLVELDRDPINP